MSKSRYTWVVIGIFLFLLLIPFFWLAPGQLDLGGDSSRLYYYQPLEYLRQQSLFPVSKSLLGGENLSYHAIPHFLFLAVLKRLLGSPTLLISLFYGVNLSFAFLFCYLTFKELLSSEQDSGPLVVFIASVIASLYYVFPPQQNFGWRHVILTFNQIFLNPLMFYLLLRHFLSRRFRYIAIALFISLIFSPNFSYVGAPPFFAFFPMSIAFLWVYTTFIRMQPVPAKGLLIALFVFVLLHAFHLLPTVMNVFTPQSANAFDLFSKEARLDRGLGYFVGIAGSVRASVSLIGLPQLTEPSKLAWLYSIFPLLFLFGYLWEKRKTYLLTGAFFLVALFWTTAKITNLGFSFYKALFVIPGFSMFRNFYGQWGLLYLFVYSLLLSQALYSILAHIKKLPASLLVGILTALLVIPALSFLRGDVLQKTFHWQTRTVKSVFRMDPAYEEVLSYIRSLPKDGKILTLPFTDPGYQVLAGTDESAYEGPSTIAFLTDKQDVTGYQELGQYRNYFVTLVKNRNYEAIKRLLTMLNIKYIFYNADPAVYDTNFPYQPYNYMRYFFPKDQKGYKEFLSELSVKRMYSKNDKYFLYEIDYPQYLPEVFIADEALSFDGGVSDWSIPLSLRNVKANLPTFFEQHAPPSVSRSYVLARPESVFPDILKNPDDPRVLHHSFVTTSPRSFLYPLILLKEALSFYWQTRKGDEFRVDRQLFLSAKRVLEVERWGDTVIVDRYVRTITDLKKYFTPSIRALWKDTNTMETVIARYWYQMNDAITLIDGAKKPQRWKIYQRFLVNEYLYQHRERFVKVFHNVGEEENEKEGVQQYLLDLIDLVFSDLIAKNNFNPPDVQEIEYRAAIPADGSYKALLRATPVQYGRDVVLNTGDQLLTLNVEEDKETWKSFPSLIKSANEEEDVFRLQTMGVENLFSRAERFSVERISEATDAATLAIDASLIVGRGGLIWRMNDIIPQTHYLLSFEYKTHEAPFEIRIIDEEIKQNVAVDRHVLSVNTLFSKKWEKYYAVAKSSAFANTMFVQFANGSFEVPVSKLEVKNLSLVPISFPTVAFERVSDDVNNPIDSDTTVIATKIDPTRYRVQISNPSGKSFILVLNQKYNKRWAVLPTHLTSSLSLFEKIRTFVNPVRLAESSHFKVNGDANAWYINPADFGNNQTFELTIEMMMQRIFYVGAAISLLGLVVLFLLFIRPPRL